MELQLKPRPSRPPLRFRTQTLLAACLWTAAAAGLRAQTQWTVDDSGGSQFTSLQAAIDAASPGDVLKIKPGNYGDVVLTKRLRLLGEPPEPSGSLPRLLSLDIQSPSAFSLSHLEVRRLRVSSVANRSEIDRCVLGGGSPWGSAGGLPPGWTPVLLHGAQDLLISRSSTPLPPQVTPVDSSATGLAGMVIEAGSTVQLVQCSVLGGDALQNTSGWFSGWGGTGLEVKQASRVWLVDTSVTGGDGEDLNVPLGPQEQGIGGTGLELSGGSTVDARGTPQHQIRGGYPMGASSPIGPAVEANGASTLLLHANGVALNGTVPTTSGAAWLQISGFTPPRLLLEGPSSPGSLVKARVYGSASPGGLPVVLFANLTPALIELPGLLLGTPALTDPSQVIYQAVQTITNPSTPADFPFTLPSNPAFTGLRVHLQAVQVWPGALYGSNLQAFVLTW